MSNTRYDVSNEFEQDMNKWQQKITDLEHMNIALERDNANLRNNMSSIDGWQEKIKELEGKLLTVNAQLGINQRAIAELERSVDNRQVKINELIDEIDGYKSIIESLEPTKALRNLLTEIGNLTSEYANE